MYVCVWAPQLESNTKTGLRRYRKYIAVQNYYYVRVGTFSEKKRKKYRKPTSFRIVFCYQSCGGQRIPNRYNPIVMVKGSSRTYIIV